MDPLRAGQATTSVGAPGWVAFAGVLVLLALMGLHIGWRVEPVLRYQQLVPPFFTDTSFFARFPAVPGGLLTYAAAAWGQLSYHNWLGAVAFTLAIGGVALGAWRLFAGVARSGALGAAYAFATLAGALPGRFEGQVEATVLGLLAALAATHLWSAGSGRGPAVQLATAWLLAGGLFYIAGALPLALYVSLAMTREWLVRGGRWSALAHGTPCLIILGWWWLRPGYVPFEAVRQWGTGLTLALNVVLLAFAPLWLLGSAVGDRRANTGRLLGFRRWAAKSLRGRLTFCAAGLVAAAVLWAVSLDRARQAAARLEYRVSRGDWDGALSAVGGVRRWTASTRLDLVRALAHAGRLPDDLFRYPQRRGVGLLPAYDAGLEMSRALGQTLLELGQVNLAEHMLHEALELEGPRPHTLAALADVNRLKGHPVAARVFLNRLALAPFQRARAERALETLAADLGGSLSADLAAVQSRLPKTDEPEYWVPTEQLLLQLLAANRTNRLALDYLLAHRLLQGQLPELAQDLRRLDLTVPARLPRPCQEALLLYLETSPPGVEALRALPIDADCQERRHRFVALARSFTDPAAARAALAAEFGDSFWYYQLFGETSSQRRGGVLRRGP